MCIGCGCAVFIIIAGAALLPLFSLRLYSKLHTDEEIVKSFDQFENEVITLPAAWQEPAPVPTAEVVDFQQKFYEDVKTASRSFRSPLYSVPRGTSHSLFMTMHTAEPLSPPQQQTVSAAVLSIAPVIKETSAALHLPTYTSDMLLYTTSTKPVGEVVEFARLSCLTALEAARQGDCRQAMELAALPLRYMQFHRPATIDLEVQKQSVTVVSLKTFVALAETCTDREALLHGLEILNELRDWAQPLPLDQALITDELAWLTRAKAFGYPVDLSPQTKASLMKQWIDVAEGPYYTWALQQFPPDDPRHKVARDMVDRRNRFVPEKSRKKKSDGAEVFTSGRSLAAVSRFLFGADPLAVMSAMAQPRNENAAKSDEVVFAQYDLTRLRFAQRLAELDNAPAAATAAEAGNAIQPYLQTVPADPFSSGTMRYHGETRQFYSIGPDGIDDGLAKIYKSSMGVYSKGDVVAPREP